MIALIIGGCRSSGSGGNSGKNGNSSGSGNSGGRNGNSCSDISYESVKNTANFPFYDLFTNIFLQQQLFWHYPVSDADTYETILKNNGFVLEGSSNETRDYMHFSVGSEIDVRVSIFKLSNGSFIARIHTYGLNPNSNQNLLSVIAPTGVPLVQYQLVEHYIDERNFVIDHIDQYKSSLKELDFKETEDNYGLMRKEVGNCIYSWLYQHHDDYLNANNGYINYNWVIVDKTFENL